MAVPNQPYGDKGKQVAAQRAMPMGTPELPQGAPQGAPPDLGMGHAIAAVPSLTAPTDRPNEPITAGLMSGPGPGPDASMGSQVDSPEVADLRALYMQFPYDGLRRLLDTYNAGRQ